MILMQESREDQVVAPEQRRSSNSQSSRFADDRLANPHGPEHFSGPFWLIDLQARYFDVIDRYVRKRVADPQRAREVVNQVFTAAAASGSGGEIAANPLPWLIATARRACARALLGEYSTLHRAIA